MQVSLEQLVTATQQGNWRVVNQCLQQVSWNTAGEFEQVLHSSLQVLNFGDFRERWEVAKIIPKLGKAAIAALLLIVEDEERDVEVRWFAVRILGGLNEPQVILPLVNLIRTKRLYNLVDKFH